MHGAVVASHERLALTNQSAADAVGSSGVDVQSSITTDQRRACPLPHIWRIPVRGRAADPPEDARRYGSNWRLGIPDRTATLGRRSSRSSASDELVLSAKTGLLALSPELLRSGLSTRLGSIPCVDPPLRESDAAQCRTAIAAVAPRW
jgi:hypothetical protein